MISSSQKSFFENFLTAKAVLFCDLSLTKRKRYVIISNVAERNGIMNMLVWLNGRAADL